MPRQAFLAGLLLLAACAPAYGEAGPASRPAPLPADVAAFVARRESCDHFRGEDPYDAERAAELKAAMARDCTGTDRALAALRRKYAGDRRVIRRLAAFDDTVE